jgi:hypothetical protein
LKNSARLALFDSANRERAQRGLSQLQWDEHLAAAARQHGLLMARQNTLAHQLPGEAEPAARGQQAGARFSAFAENVAYGPDAAEIHDGLMKSPPHRKNLLDPQLNSMGVAVVDRGGTLFAAEDFSREVAALSIEEQESRVGALLKARGLTVASENAEARRVCRLGPGHERSQRPVYVVRFTGADLDKLPVSVGQALRSGRYHTAEVGACALDHPGDFAGYQIALLFFQ